MGGKHEAINSSTLLLSQDNRRPVVGRIQICHFGKTREAYRHFYNYVNIIREYEQEMIFEQRDIAILNLGGY